MNESELSVDFSKVLYAPLRIEFDKQQLLNEALNIPENVFEFQKTYWHGNTFETSVMQFDGLVVGTEEENRAFPRQFVDKGQLKVVEGSGKSFRVAHLSHVPEEPQSMHKAVKYDNGDFIRLRLKHATEWVLREDIAIPEIKKAIQSLPFTHFSLIRLCIYDPGSFTPVHRDEPNANYKSAGYQIINIILEDGGVQMVMRANKRDYFGVDNCYLFDFSYPHGVPPARSRRVVLCVEGQLDSHRASLMIDHSKSIKLFSPGMSNKSQSLY